MPYPFVAGEEATAEDVNNALKFGGDGSDGALSGNQTIDAGNANIVIKNYSSINIGVGETLQLSNKATDGTILVLRCTGDVTIAGTIDLDGDGADANTNGYGVIDSASNHHGTTGSSGMGVILANKHLYITTNGNLQYLRSIILAAGSGGTTGGNGTTGALGGAGGAGGGALLIECRGALNFTGTININGLDGTDGSTSGASGGGGGGGGAAGMAMILYITLTENSGTINAIGGEGGDGAGGGNSGSNYQGGDGGSGAGSITDDGGAGGNSSYAGAGSAGEATTSASGAGGGGGGANGGAGGAGGGNGSSDANHHEVAKNTSF